MEDDASTGGRRHGQAQASTLAKDFPQIFITIKEKPIDTSFPLHET
jgi:hypothetical protein